MTTHPKMRDAIKVVQLGERFVVISWPATVPFGARICPYIFTATKDEAIEHAKRYAAAVIRPVYVIDRLSREDAPRGWKVICNGSVWDMRPSEILDLKPQIDWSDFI